jgi:hypothetical protein
LIDFCFFPFVGMDDTVHVSEDIGEVGITSDVTAVSPPPRLTVEAGSSIGVGSLFSEVADFLKEFDAKAPNPHHEQYFWSFNGPLVRFVCGPRINPREGWTRAKFVCGMLSPKLYTKCGRLLGG